MRRESTDVPCSGFVREMMVSIIIFLNVTTSSFLVLHNSNIPGTLFTIFLSRGPCSVAKGRGQSYA